MRGVKVRLLVDGLRSRLPSDFEQYLRRCGIETMVYHPTHKGLWLNRRLHIKLMVADSSTAIIGSRNLRDEHFGLGSEKNYIDCDAIVAGDSAVKAQTYFDWLWRTRDVDSKPHRASLGLGILKYRPGDCDACSKAWRHASCPADFQRLLFVFGR